MTHFVFPLEFGPHLPELQVGATGRDYVVHDVDLDVTQIDAVPVTHAALQVIDWRRKKSKHTFRKEKDRTR